MKRILIIEDEREYAQMLSDAIREFSTVPVDVVMMNEADDLLRFCEKEQPRLSGVVLDIQLPPGTLLRNQDTKGGTWTGTVLYERLGAWLRVFHPQGTNLPIAVHTHILDEQLKFHLEDAHRLRWPQLPLRFYYKPMDVVEFSQAINQWFDEV